MTSLNLDAIYLAGYAAECSLKSLILHWTPKAKRAEVREEISTTAKAHNLDYLRGRLKQRGCTIPSEMLPHLDLIQRRWCTKLRYETALVPRDEANELLDCVDQISRWVEGQT